MPSVGSVLWIVFFFQMMMGVKRLFIKRVLVSRILCVHSRVLFIADRLVHLEHISTNLATDIVHEKCGGRYSLLSVSTPVFWEWSRKQSGIAFAIPATDFIQSLYYWSFCNHFLWLQGLGDFFVVCRSIILISFFDLLFYFALRYFSLWRINISFPLIPQR